MSIRLITFDLDDTLWPSAPVLAHAESTLHTWLAEHAPPLAARYDSTAMREHRLLLLQQQPELVHEISRWRMDSLKLMLTEVGYAGAEAAELARAAFAVFLEARHRVSYYEGSLEILEQLAQRYTLVGLTNGNADIFRLEAGRFFRHAFRAEQLKACKPAPELFRAALRAAGCEAHEAVHIGDDPEKDIRAATQLGMHAIQARLLPSRAMEAAMSAEGALTLEGTMGFQCWQELPALIAAIEGEDSSPSEQ